MSVSVTVHDVGPPSPIAVNPLTDLETARKMANEKLRIRRLVQVRQQSKQIAAKVRQNYQQAKEKELAKIEQTKREELKSWKQQQVRQLQEEYARCVSQVGEAHKAAEAAEECAVWFEEKRATQQANALQRGKAAEQAVARERERKESLREAKVRKKPYVPSKSVAVQACIPDAKPKEAPIPAPVEEVDSDSSDLVSSPFEQFRACRNRAEDVLPGTIPPRTEHKAYIPGTVDLVDKENCPGMGRDYNATAFTSPSELRPVVEPQRRLQPFTQITDLIQQRRHRQQESDDLRRGPATHKTSSTGHCGVYGVQKNVQFDDVSDNTLSFPTSSVLTSDDRPVSVGPGSPRKVPPRKLVEQPKMSLVHGQLGAIENAATVGATKRDKAVLPESSSTSTYYGPSTKVQYYDYNTKYRKEYDQPVGFVRREKTAPDGLSGMEEANRYEQLQQELANARRKPTIDRSKPALEKQQTRMDYEKLSKELDNLTRTGNKLKSMAAPTKSIPSEAIMKQKKEARQRKANDAVEGLLQQRALITCPVVRLSSQQSDFHRPVARPSVMNVAAMPVNATGQESHSKDVSTDSCTSIVLGTFDRPRIPLPGEEVDGGTDKIAKLQELLKQINEQRRLLTAEIAHEKAEESAKEPAVETGREMTATDTTKMDIDRLERMKRRQEELIEQQRLLQQREHEVEELGRQLRQKMDMLQSNQQKRQETVEAKASKRDRKNPPKHQVHVETKGGHKGTIDVAVAQHPPSSSISEESSDSVAEQTGDAPVKIVITVNEKGTPSKRKHKKKITLKQKKSPVKAAAVETAKEKPQKATVPEEPVRSIVKPFATKKETLLKQVTTGMAPAKTTAISPGSASTTSTVYRALPPKIGSLKINGLLPVAGGSVAASVPKHHLQKSTPNVGGLSRGRNLNPHLLKYIVRLLGMSRQSIDQLGVSSTSISTPNESVVNVSSNIDKRPDPSEEDIERTNRLRQFIDDNYNFLQEVDETLRRSDQSTIGSSDRSDAMQDADVSRVEDVWLKTLRHKERSMQKQQPKGSSDAKEIAGRTKSKKKQKEREKQDEVDLAPPTNASRMEPYRIPSVAVDNPVPTAVPIAVPTAVPIAVPTAVPPPPTVRDGSLKSILKSPKKDALSKVAKIITPQGHVEVINLSDREEQEILERYSQLTERCSQRITELSHMINQVREEKRRLIEDSLSSLEQQESTKYMDLPAAIGASQPRLEAVSAPPTVPATMGDDPVSEEIDNIISSKQIGLSKDSGIAMSRPLTASDIRESPSEEGSQGKEPLPFEPFLKDIPRPTVDMVRDGPRMVGVGTGGNRRSAPPVAITRFSPQLDDLAMHELSTIPEVETPAVATSKVNDLSALSGGTEQVLIEARNRLVPDEAPEIGYDRFPNYEEYVRRTADGATRTMEQTMERDEKSELRLDVTEERVPETLKYRSFPDPVPPFDVTEEGPSTECDPDKLEYRRFPGPVPPFDVTEEGTTTVGDPEKLDYRKFPGPVPPFDVTEEAVISKSGSDTSLPDVVAELKRRNIFVKSFNNSLDNSNRSTPLSDGPIIQRPSEGASNPVPSRETQMVPLLQQLSDSLGRDLEKVAGLQWASSMLKRNQLEQHSSGSSPVSVTGAKDGPNDDTLENDPGGAGRAPKLSEFIARELMVRTQSDLQSLSSVSSSSASHSTLLRSLLNMTHLNNTNSSGSSVARELLMHTPTDSKNVQRTSTPVASKSTVSGSSMRMIGDVTDSAANRTETGLFSGESHLSSVHLSSSSGSSLERHPPPQQLTAPNLRLERQTSSAVKQDDK